MMNVIDQDWITTAEAAALTGYTQEYIRKLARDETIKSAKIGERTTLISKEDLLRYYNKQQERKE